MCTRTYSSLWVDDLCQSEYTTLRAQTKFLVLWLNITSRARILFQVPVAQPDSECHPPKVEVAGSNPVRDTTESFGVSKAACTCIQVQVLPARTSRTGAYANIIRRVDIGKAACSASRFRYFPRTSKYGACVTSPAGRTLPDVAPP